MGVQGDIFIKYKKIDKPKDEKNPDKPDENLEYFHAVLMPLIRLSEVYYIAAECTTDLGEAARWLNLVRKARNLEEKKFNSFSEVQAYLTAEYRREFYSEGQLFYRYKWLNASAIDYCTINIADKLEQVYILPLPDQEKEFGGVANGDN